WAAGEEQMKVMVGDPDKEKEFLEEWSPVNHADRIKAPVFMAYGLQDPRVNIRHEQVMENALEDAGVPFEVMIKKDEGHGYRKQENRYDFYGKMDEFLAKYIGNGGTSTSSP
ncbi:MAG: prolyl oligopeptidase family serine peptidase, partial [Lysobacterales bacterium]